MIKLSNQYQIVCTIDLNQCECEHYNWLFQNLKSWDHVSFDPEQRILFTYSGSISMDLLSHVQRVINFLDITNCFVLIATNDHDVASKIQLVTNTVSTDSTCFNFELVDLDPVDIDRPKTKFALPDTLCLAPWAKMEVTSDGGVAPCCMHSSHRTGGIADESGKIIQVTDGDVAKIYFGKEFSKLRKEMLSGAKPLACNRCWTNEQAGVKSLRQNLFWNFRSQLYNIDFYNDSLDNLKSVHLLLGNICNLRCRICSPTNSSKIAIEALTQLPKSERKSSLLFNQLKQKSWVNNQNLGIWHQYLEMSKNLTEIIFTGGEPMLIDKQFELIHEIASRGWSKNITLDYTTNGTVFPDHAVKDWRLFKALNVSISLDDIGQRFEYQRYGAKWQTVKQNIYQYHDLKQQVNLVLRAQCTISSLNIWNLPDLCHALAELPLDFANLELLHLPRELSVRHLSLTVKEKLIKHLSTAKYPERFRTQVDQIINFINLPSDNLQGALIDHIRKFDIIRNQNFADVSPEMTSLIDYHK